MTDQGDPPRIDGRRARGERTRLNVLEALLALVEEGQLRPTAQEVAERAGVALRTVYHHFEDVEALRRLAFDLQVGRNREALRPMDTSLPTVERCRQVAHRLRRFYEAISPIRRAVVLEERSSPQMAEVLRRSRLMRRQFVESAFESDVNSRGVPERRSILDSLDVTTSWQSWYYLRASLGRGAQAAERVLAFELEHLLSGRGGAVAGGPQAAVGGSRSTAGQGEEDDERLGYGPADVVAEREVVAADDAEVAAAGTRTMTSSRGGERRRRSGGARPRPGR